MATIQEDSGIKSEFPGLERYFLNQCQHGHYSFCLHGCFAESDVKELVHLFQSSGSYIPTTRENINRILALKYEEARSATRDLSVIYSEIAELEEMLAVLMEKATEIPPYDGAQ